MRKCLTILLLCPLLSIAPRGMVVQRPASGDEALISGTWLITEPPVGPDTRVTRWKLQFERDGSISGANPDGLPLRGTLRGDAVAFEILRRADGARVQFTGRLEKGVIRGQRVVIPSGGAAASAPRDFIATPDRPGRPPRLHTFAPQTFYRSFSGAVPAALRIIPGDTVQTWTLDNAGADADGVVRSPAGNPLTGPFYIDGALAGDMLAVRLHRVRLNRNYGRSGTEIVENALTGSDLRRLTPVPGFDGRWRFDRERGVAMLERPTAALDAFTVPLRPMLGCIGVAPPGGQAILATESGSFGGNMDYNEIREGVTVYLPVFQNGAMLFIGDGHAVQGDGELTGDAVETSLDVEFSVEVFPSRSTLQRRLDHPRAESEDFLMAIGISGDLSGALRLATSDLARWLEEDYGLNPSELASVLGTRLRYDIAEVVGSQVSVVAKIPKEALKQLKRRSGGQAALRPHGQI